MFDHQGVLPKNYKQKINFTPKIIIDNENFKITLYQMAAFAEIKQILIFW